MFAYGSPKNPQKPRLNNALLAPGTKNPPADLASLTDAEVFQAFEAIQLKDTRGLKLSAYESFRLNDLDRLLDSNPSGWDQKVKDSVKEHYEVVRDLVKPRILGLFSGPPPVANGIAQAQCQAFVRIPPPPKPKPRPSHTITSHHAKR
jgi:hypothetical protein